VPPAPPVIILVRPQLGENIGAVARAMSNFGLTELRLVAPRDGWPNKRALETASGADAIIEAAKVYPDFAAAIADIQVAYATTARPRDMAKRVVTPEVAAQEMSAALRIALVFGPERTGLENEEINWCDTLITIPTAEKASLNLAQSVVVVGYEWWKAACHPTQALHPSPDDNNVAPKADYQALFDHLETCLDAGDYFRTPTKKTLMWQNIRTMLLRGQWSSQEIQTFRGMVRNLWEQRSERK